jgi:lipopolysaccharide export system permease protein
MRVIERYIGRQFVLAYVLASILLLGLFSFYDLSDQLGDVGKGAYTTVDAIDYTVLGLPQRFVDLMSFTALLATIITLGLMAQRQELVVLRSAGISALRIAGTIFKIAVVLLAINIALQMTVAPQLLQRAEQMRAAALAGHADFGNSFWIRSRRGILHIGGLRDGRIPVDVEFYRFAAGHALARYIHAQRADPLSSHRWRLHGVLSKRFTARGDRTRRRRMVYIDPALYPNQLQILNRPPASLSPQALYHYIGYLQRQGENARRFTVAFWQKLAVLFTTLAMMLFAIPLAFANPRGAHFGLRLVIGALIGLGVYAAGQATANLALLLAFNPAVLTFAPGLLFIALALYWLRRIS